MTRRLDKRVRVMPDQVAAEKAPCELCNSIRRKVMVCLVIVALVVLHAGVVAIGHGLALRMLAPFAVAG